MREGMGTMDTTNVQERWIYLRDEFDDLERQGLQEAVNAQADSSSTEAAKDEDGQDEMEYMASYITESGIKVVRRP